MRSKTRAAVGAARAAPLINQNTLPQSQSQHCFQGEILADFLKSVQREIKAARDEALSLKFWIKQQFAFGINEVTRGLQQMPPHRGDEKSQNELFGANVDDSEARHSCFQAILLAADCNPQSLTKHLPILATSRNVPLKNIDRHWSKG